MGHANVSNLSEFFIRRLYAKGTLTIAECADAMEAKGETVHASEGELEDNCMLRHGLEQVVSYLLDEHFLDRDTDAGPVIVPASLTDEQKSILDEWCSDKMLNWDCGDDGNGGQYAVLDGIAWKFAPNWRKNYKRVPLLRNVTN